MISDGWLRIYVLPADGKSQFGSISIKQFKGLIGLFFVQVTLAVVGMSRILMNQFGEIPGARLVKATWIALLCYNT